MVNSTLKPELQKAINNVEKCKVLVRDKVPTDKANALLKLIDAMEEQLIVAPASTRLEYHGAFFGGLVDHSLRVVKIMALLNKSYEAGISSESIVTTGLFHDIGKCGDGNKEYYVPKTSDWHIKQGIMFEVNPTLLNMPPSLRSLFLLQKFGVGLSEEEHYAISSIKDRYRVGEESQAVMNEPILAVVLQQAIRVASLKGAGVTSLPL